MNAWCTVLAVATLVTAPGSASQSLGQLPTSPVTVTLANGQVEEVEYGELLVPESRRRPTERRITIPFYRLRSTSVRPAAPIFLLAGGPGSSWLEQFKADETHREAAFYRSVADVVLFDQRGGGHARPKLTCPDREQMPLDASDEQIRVILRKAVTRCRERWVAEGVDLASYNSVENAADVNDLRLALGYGKVTLVGGSYGSHLALQVMRQFPEAVERAVLFGVEGPDHTWDDPAAMLRTLQRIAARAEQAPELHDRIPAEGLLGTLGRVIDRLERSPETVKAKGSATPVQVDAATVRRMARFNAGRRSAPHIWPQFILAMARGDFSIPARGRIENGAVSVPDPVHFSMDCASGVSPARRARYSNDPAAKLLGNINLEYELLCDAWPAEQLGEAFHDNVVSDVPTLLVQGTWDLSTPLENAHDVARGLSKASVVEVVEGGHGALYNLYEHWPPMHDMMRRFLTGAAVEFPHEIRLPAASFDRAR